MGAKSQTLNQDRPQDAPAVAKSSQLALRTGDTRVIRHVDLDDLQSPCHRFTRQLGLDLEPRRFELYHLAIAAAESAIAREQVAIRRADQEAECRPDQEIPQSPCHGHCAGTGSGLTGADGHVGLALQHGRDQFAGRAGRIGAVAVGENHHIVVAKRRKAACTAWPFPWSGTSTTRTPSDRAIAPVPSVELLSNTTISAAGKAARNCAITVAIAAASLKHGIATAIRECTGSASAEVVTMFFVSCPLLVVSC